MSEYLPLLIVAGLVVCMYQLGAIRAHFRDVDARLDALMRHHGMNWGSPAEPSDHVRQLAVAPGSMIEAIKAYRQQTGVGLKEAKAVVETLAREGRSEV